MTAVLCGGIEECFDLAAPCRKCGHFTGEDECLECGTVREPSVWDLADVEYDFSKETEWR